MTASTIDLLRETVDELERVYHSVRADLDSRKTVFYKDSTLAQDPNGRYILLDTLVALTNARAALVAAVGDTADEPAPEEYEYEAQWYSDGSDSWIPSGWKGFGWTTKAKANADLTRIMADSSYSDVRSVRRRKAGPVEVVSEYP